MASGSDTRASQTLILLVILGAAGGWNFHRNTQIDNAVLRPYRHYADEDLQQLISAYRSEVDVQMERYRSDPSAKTVSVRDAGLLGTRSRNSSASSAPANSDRSAPTG
jgi:hypothetical protein